MEGNTVISTEVTENKGGVYTKDSFRHTCLKVGGFMITLFIFRIIGRLTSAFLPLDTLSARGSFFASGIISVLCMQILPSLVAVLVFKLMSRDETRLLYKKPRKLVKAVGNFPAIYGLGITVNLLTIIVTYLVSPKDTDIAESVNTLNSLQPPDMASALGLFFLLVVIAPLFEEFIFRGAIQTALTPYGNGFAILVSGISFGIFHGNFSQVFYTTVFGIALGYIRYATGSLVPTMIIHALVNGMSGVLLLFLATDSVQDYLLNMNNADAAIPDTDMLVVLAFAVFVIFMLLMAIVGVILAVIKIKNIRKYKIKKQFTEISGAKKAGIFFSRVTVIAALILTVDCFAGSVIANTIYKLFSGGAA